MPATLEQTSLKLSDTTLNILKNFATINPGIEVRSGSKLQTIAPTRVTVASANVPDVFPANFCIYDLNEFLGVLSAFKNPVLDFTADYVTISDGSRHIQYYYADVSMINRLEREVQLPEDWEISFELTENAFDEIQKITGILFGKDKRFIIDSDGQKIYLKTFDLENPTSHSYSNEIGPGNGIKFRMIYNLDNLKLVKGAYQVDLSSKRIGKFSHKSLDLVYLIMLEVESKYNF